MPYKDYDGVKPLPQTSREAYTREKERYDLIHVRLEKTMGTALRGKSSTSGVSQAELIRTYIEWGLENDGG
jgi:hypothetical protein